MYKNCVRISFCFMLFHNCICFTPPTSFLPDTSMIHNVLNVSVPLIVPAHGSVDILHALQEKKTKNYLGSNLAAYVGFPLVHYINDDAGLFLFLALSAYHFRHQFTFAGNPINFLLSSIFVSLTIHNPDLVYIFLAFVHTPHQYWKFREFL